MMPSFFTRHIGLMIVLACAGPSPRAEEEPPEKTEEQMALEKKERLEKRIAAEKKIKAQFDYSFNDISRKIVLVTCDSDRGQSFGSGFVATLDGKTYLFTNQHVILGADKIRFKTAYGETLRPRNVELSVTRDIARLRLTDEVEGFSLTHNVELDAPIGVFGNSEGSGVATELYGKVTHAGSELVAVSADFVPGNSGSPVLDLNQQVVGIASYVRWYSSDDTGKKTKRFCYRITGSQWKQVNWKKYNEKYGRQYRMNEAIVESVLELADIWYDAPYNRMTADNHRDGALRKWATAHNRVINRIMRLHDQGRATSHELNNTNKQIKQDMGDSAEALSSVCRKYARRMRFLATQEDLTGFLTEEYERLNQRLESTARQVDRFGKTLSDSDYFSFK